MYQSYQTNQQNGLQNQWGASAATSQYRGLNQPYQPVGFVQSQYNQNQNQNQQFQNQQFQNQQFQNQQFQNQQFQNQNQQYQAQNQKYGQAQSFASVSSFQPQNQSQNQFQNTQAFHNANYRGNQPGHDNYWRADSTQPSNIQAASGFQNRTSAYSNVSSAIGSQQVGQQQYAQQSPQSFHTANYRGDQPGHDNYWRADSTQPSASAQNQFANTWNSVNANQFTASSQPQGIGQYQNNAQNQQAYHTSSYRGNQQGHDSYLRADSFQPSQSQYNSTNAG